MSRKASQYNGWDECAQNALVASWMLFCHASVTCIGDHASVTTH